MKIKTFLFAAGASSLLFSCNNQETVEKKAEEHVHTHTVEDVHTYAKPEEAVVTHLNWDANVNFDTKTISATATWDIKTSEDAKQITFDIFDLNVSKVTVDGAEANFTVGDFDENMGSPLTIDISPEAKKVAITYTTGDNARALQWLDAEQTAGKKKPFLFTQSQAILARSWVPTQDGPGIRFTYDAKVKVPSDMIALMSADNPKERNETGEYTFKMPQPIPSYLLAMAVGDVQFKAISARTGVYAEESLLDTSVYEFSDLENMVQAAESLYGPYAWGQYDIIVLPPSFPFGGMENPRLTFATPTILAGDKSLVSLVAHELAHSWSGNLVTNATWDDFWLNEGFTVYFEHRIMEKVYGKDYSEMLASLTRQELIEAAHDMMETMPNDTKLKLDLKGRNPDDGVTSIPYNKGYFMLRLIEEKVGREKFDAFLKNYFETNKFSVMTTEQFLDYLEENLLTKEQMDELKLNEWIYETGIPDNLPVVKSNRFNVVDTARGQWLMTDILPMEELTENWTTHEWLHFINGLPRKMSTDKLAALDAEYGFTKSGNSEISAAWFQPTIRSNYEPVYGKVESFLISVGRRKFLTPTYKALIESDKKDMALDIYKKARPNYHAVSRETLDELMDYHQEK
ncbi:M1 family metallopeptidase [Owenweeksia hongkongensis]|uniref:M1 family metallopeptidase n=1 Tax=Owenweeksia hongkongensis TaxID=253245 RepID=UPI003A8F1747